MRKKKQPNLKTWLVPKLRRHSFSWKPRKDAMKKYRVELPPKLKKDGTPGKKPQVRYRCNHCSEVFKTADIVLDHVIPVVEPKIGWKNWDAFIESLFCDEAGFQVLCNPCHDEKTHEENEIRHKKK